MYVFFFIDGGCNLLFDLPSYYTFLSTYECVAIDLHFLDTSIVKRHKLQISEELSYWWLRVTYLSIEEFNNLLYNILAFSK